MSFSGGVNHWFQRIEATTRFELPIFERRLKAEKSIKIVN